MAEVTRASVPSVVTLAGAGPGRVAAFVVTRAALMPATSTGTVTVTTNRVKNIRVGNAPA
jgi:hypothetical protein